MDDYQAWWLRYAALAAPDRAAIVSHIAVFSDRPVVTLIMPVKPRDMRWLRNAIAAVRRQLYPDWRLCLMADAGLSPPQRALLACAAETDPRIRTMDASASAGSDDWLRLLERVSTEYFAILYPEDALAEQALYLVAEKLNAVRELVLIYGDHDCVGVAHQRSRPYFKPDWNPDLLLSGNYIQSLAVFHYPTVRHVSGSTTNDGHKADSRFFTYDLLLRLGERCPPHRIAHIPFILCSLREPAQFSGERLRELWAAAGREHLARAGIRACVRTGDATTKVHRIVYAVPSPTPLVSIIIPTRDNHLLLVHCIDSIKHRTSYGNYELMIVNNASDDPATLRYLEQLAGLNGVRIVDFPGRFNYSAIINHAVSQAAGEFVCLLNDDTRIISPDWLEELVGHAARPEVGVVGAKLYYPDSTVQHAGIVVGIFGVCGHVHRHLSRGAGGYQNLAIQCQDRSAVTAACMLMRKAVFEEVGGMDAANLAVSFNDIDFCLRAAAHGYRVLWTPWAELFHIESATLGPGNITTQRFREEYAWIRRRWGERLRCDPFYNPNLSLGHEDYRLACPPRVTRPWQQPARLTACGSD